VALTVVLTVVVSVISIAYLKLSERGHVTRY
jgi:raffinose/stachyose/melibiose transport system permease protein